MLLRCTLRFKFCGFDRWIDALALAFSGRGWFTAKVWLFLFCRSVAVSVSVVDGLGKLRHMLVSNVKKLQHLLVITTSAGPGMLQMLQNATFAGFGTFHMLSITALDSMCYRSPHAAMRGKHTIL